MSADKITARLAGLIYSVVVLTGIFSLAYVPSKLIVWDDAAKTFQNIAAAETLFRLSLVSSAICYIAFLLLPFVLSRLLRAVDETAAKLMVVLAVVSVPVSFLNLQNKYAVLTFVNGARYLTIFSEQQIHSQIMPLLDNYNNGILIVQVFWGLWLLPFGFLVYKSGFLPKILGVLLMLGCFGYLISFVGNSMLPDYGETVISRFDTLPASLGEIGTCLWLLIVGIRDKRTPLEFSSRGENKADRNESDDGSRRNSCSKQRLDNTNNDERFRNRPLLLACIMRTVFIVPNNF